ncbi:MAG: guanylate kinase [Flavobacteriales bacterium AspAUS03]
MHTGKIIIFSAPSGSGKTTIVHHLLTLFPTLAFSISCTTRPARSYEREGKDYYFISLKAFQSKIQKGEFAEWEEVYPGMFYGTLKSEIQRIWATGRYVLFDIDVKGGLNLKKKYPGCALAIFVQPPSLLELQHRIRSRQTESPTAIAIRLEKAHYEWSYATQFDKVLVNDDLKQAQRQAACWVVAFIHA